MATAAVRYVYRRHALPASLRRLWLRVPAVCLVNRRRVRYLPPFGYRWG